MNIQTILLLSSGSICFILAVVIGGYRTFCIYKHDKYHGADDPYVWRFLSFRLFSWLFVAAMSIWAAGVAASVTVAQASLLTSPWMDKGLFGFVFGGMLGLRWALALFWGAKLVGRV